MANSNNSGKNKIIICTTFRDFNGSENDDIQLLFLKSIMEQTYNNYLVVATIFGEKNVESALNQSVAKEKLLIYKSELKDYKYSLTEVVLNGIDAARKFDDSIVIWTTCDVIFEKDFFQNIRNVYRDKLCGIIHPNIGYATLSDYYNQIKIIRGLNDGIDTMFFATNFFTDTVYDKIMKYKFYNWGIFEVFLVGLSRQFSRNRFNLYGLNKLHKIYNDRVVLNEDN
jgi:hypothetical protein